MSSPETTNEMDELVLDIDGTEHRFKNKAALTKWIEKERDFHIGLMRAERGAKEAEEEGFQQILERLAPAKEAALRHAGTWMEIQRSIQKLLSSFPRVDSPDGKFLARLASRNPNSASAAFRIMRNQNPENLRNLDQFQGAVLGSMFKFGFVANQGDGRDRFNLLNTEIGNWFAQVQQELNHVIANTENEFRDFQMQIEADKKRLRQELAIEAPNDYWKGQESHHRARSWWFSMGLWTLVVLTLAIISAVGYWILDQARNDQGKLDLDDTAARFVLLTTFGAIIAVLFWSLRILAKRAQGHTHLLIDARERQTLIQTYRALAKNTELSDKDDTLKLILAPIFRPTPDGIVRDDGGPVPWYLELLRPSK